MPFNQVDPDTGKITYGLVGYTYNEVLKKLNDNVIANIAEETDGAVTSIDTSEDSILGRWHGIIAERIVGLYSEGLKIQDAFYVETATGSSLNKLALLSGIKKEKATYTKGEIRVFGEEDTLIDVDSRFSSLKGDIFLATDSITLSSSNCFSTDIKVLLEKDSKEYYISINNIQYKITSSPSSTFYTILSQLDTAVSVNPLITTTLSADLGEDSFLHIEKVDQTSYVSINSSALLDNTNIEMELTVQAEEAGAIFGDADTIVNIESTITGLTTVNNPLDLIIGEDAHTDSDLRDNIVNEYRTTGSTTKDAIENTLLRLDYVKAAKVYENRTFEVNSDGVPAKNFEPIVFHEGSDSDVGQEILNIRPIGINSYGSTSVTAQDPSGEDVTVKFTNATVKYLHVKVDITKTSEEDYPTAGDELIKDSVTLTGSGYNIDEDVYGKRFYGSVFSAVTGVATVDIQVYADSVPITDQGSISGWVPLETIDRNEIALFATNRVFVNDLT